MLSVFCTSTQDKLLEEAAFLKCSSRVNRWDALKVKYGYDEGPLEDLTLSHSCTSEATSLGEHKYWSGRVAPYSKKQLFEASKCYLQKISDVFKMRNGYN